MEAPLENKRVIATLSDIKGNISFLEGILNGWDFNGGFLIIADKDNLLHHLNFEWVVELKSLEPVLEPTKIPEAEKKEDEKKEAMDETGLVGKDVAMLMAVKPESGVYWIIGKVKFFDVTSGLIWLRDSAVKEHFINFKYVTDIQLKEIPKG